MSTPFYDLASLVVVPSGYKASKVYAQKPLTTDGQLAFSRASTATRVNSAGLIETVSSNVPRLDYTNSTCPKLLLEPQRTNMAFWSEQFNNGTWLKLGTGLTVTANTTISPDGTQNADTLNVSNNDNVLYASRSGTLAGNTYIFSIYAKGTGTFQMNIRLNSSTTTTETKTLTSQWQRFVVSVTNAVSVTSVEYYLNLNTSSTYSVWGAQVEQASYVTSYVKTESAEVTRLADACSKTGISSLIGQTEGTLFVDYTCDNSTASAYSRAIAISDGTSNNRIYINDEGGKIGLTGIKAGVVQASQTSTVNFVGSHKVAIAYANNDVKVYVDGVAVLTDTSFDVPACTAFYVATYEEGTPNNSNNKINQALLFKTRLTNAQLAELTTL